MIMINYPVALLPHISYKPFRLGVDETGLTWYPCFFSLASLGTGWESRGGNSAKGPETLVLTEVSEEC